MKPKEIYMSISAVIYLISGAATYAGLASGLRAFVIGVHLLIWDLVLNSVIRGLRDEHVEA